MSFAPTLVGCTGVHAIFMLSFINSYHFRSDKNSSIFNFCHLMSSQDYFVFNFCHFRSAKDSFVTNNVVFPYLLMGMFSVSVSLRWSARCISPIFTFLDLLFTVPSSTALRSVKNLMIQKPCSQLESKVNGKCLLIYSRSPIQILSAQLVIL